MARSLFLIKGNICADRVRLGRALQKPPMTQEDLARKMQLMGMDITPLIISRIEKNQRHVCDAELRMLAKAMNVSMDWLCGDDDEVRL
ncbi:MAG: helix-turn-helix transcriptional regulator [Clostridia bacterium]|nr:helix-turn-helix transcriptional regulator [Clostridia bacterium]